MTEHVGNFWLEAGKMYEIALEYYENTGAAVIQFYWKGPGMDSKQLIPPSALFPYRDSDWPGFTIGTISEFPTDQKITTIHLDNPYPRIVENSWLVMFTGEPKPYTEV